MALSTMCASAKSLMSVWILTCLWSGAADVSQHSLRKASRRAHAALHAMLPLQRASSAASLAASERAQKRWDLLRMHFLDFPLQSKRLTRQKWHALVESALEQSRELGHRRQVMFCPRLFPQLWAHALSDLGQSSFCVLGWSQLHMCSRRLHRLLKMSMCCLIPLHLCMQDCFHGV